MLRTDHVKLTKIKGGNIAKIIMFFSQTVQIMCIFWMLGKFVRNTAVYSWEFLYEKSCLNGKVSKY